MVIYKALNLAIHPSLLGNNLALQLAGLPVTGTGGEDTTRVSRLRKLTFSAVALLGAGQSKVLLV